MGSFDSLALAQDDNQDTHAPTKNGRPRAAVARSSFHGAQSPYATLVFGASFSLDAPKNTSYQHRKQ